MIRSEESIKETAVATGVVFAGAFEGLAEVEEAVRSTTMSMVLVQTV